jgi:nucleoid DNA-binding protein
MAIKKPVKKVKTVTKKIAPKATKGKVVKLKPTTVSKPKVEKEVSKKSVTKTLGKITKPLTKSELYTAIADGTELNRKQVTAVFDTLSEIVALHLKKDSPEKFVLPGLLKIIVKKVSAKPAHEGKNPFTGEMMMFKAKPASKKVKVIALSSLKAMC